MFLSRGFFGTKPAPLVVYSGTLTVGKYGPWFTPGGYNNTVAGANQYMAGVGSIAPGTGPLGFGVEILHETAAFYFGGTNKANMTWIAPTAGGHELEGDYEYDVTVAGTTVRFRFLRELNGEVYWPGAYGDVFGLQSRNGQTLTYVVTRIYL